MTCRQEADHGKPPGDRGPIPGQPVRTEGTRWS